MTTIHKKLTSVLLFSVSFLGLNSSFADRMDDYATYCRDTGGIVEEMPAEILAGKVWVRGQAKMFCNFMLDNAFVSIGLETFSADEPSIAATYIKTLGVIHSGSPLLKGPYSNPADNVCQNLGGASIGFVAAGGFSNHFGQSQMCVFGDASMISGWSLIYIANHREGYDEIRSKVKAEPLEIKRVTHKLLQKPLTKTQ